MKLFIPIIIIFFLFSHCKKSCEDKCQLAPEQGHCRMLAYGYYFDNQEKKCKEFVWGGCGGVVPFKTLVECEECSCK